MPEAKKARARRKIVALEHKTTSAARTRGEALIALIQRRMARIVEDFYDIGTALREIARKKLYAAVGYTSLDALLAARKLISPAQARKLVAIVEHVPRERALELGQEKSYALVAYAAATPEPDSPETLLASNARIGRKPLATASVREIGQAARAVRARVRATKPVSPAEKARAQLARDAQRRLRAALHALGLKRVRVELVGSALTVRVPVKDAAELPAP